MECYQLATVPTASKPMSKSHATLPCRDGNRSIRTVSKIILVVKQNRSNRFGLAGLEFQADQLLSYNVLVYVDAFYTVYLMIIH